MEGHEVKFKTLNIETNTIFDESDAVPDGVDPKQHVEDLLLRFNEEENRRHKMNPNYTPQLRKLVSIEGLTGKTITGYKLCELGDKINTITVSRGNLMYDLYKCINCKLVRRRFGFAPVEVSCYPERSCVPCNKVFKTKLGLKKHNERGNHKLPDWFPDGV